MKDGVVFTDAEGTITEWNDVMQNLTAIAADAIVGQTWSSECVRLRESDSSRSEDSCMLQECLATGSMTARPMLIEQPGGQPTPVHVTVSPVIGPAPHDKRVICAFGHGHLGLTQGPATGRIVADLIAGRDPGLELAPYSPARR